MPELREYSMESSADLAKIAKALGSELRLNMIKVLTDRIMNINEIADTLEVPFSTAAVNIKQLEDAGIILTEIQPGARGSMMKVCSLRVGFINMILTPEKKTDSLLTSEFINMPIGNFSSCSVSPTCGLLSDRGLIYKSDDPKSFFHQDRLQAQLLWFYKGYIEYDFFNPIYRDSEAAGLTVSMELCSEAPFHKNEWPSDITISINGVELVTWTSPGDFGGRRGKYTPEYWATSYTQFGLLKSFSVNDSGSFVDGVQVSNVSVRDLNIRENSPLRLRVEIKENAKHVGGINIFGEHFGDYPQGLIMQVDYKKKEEEK